MKSFAPLLSVLALVPAAASAAPVQSGDAPLIPPIVAPTIPRVMPRILQRPTPRAAPPAAVAKGAPGLCLLQSQPPGAVPKRGAACDTSQAFLDNRPADPSQPQTLQLLR